VKDFGRAMLVGLGGGRTLALLHEMPFDVIDVAEHSPAVIRAARERFSGFVGEALSDPRVRLHRDDGRNRLQVARQPYDLVVAAISGAAFAGSGSLYNRDFFELVRSRLSARGVLLLWVQLHHVQAHVLRSVVFSLRATFPSVHLYVSPGGNQGFLVASSSPLVVDRAVAARLGEAPRASRVLALSQLKTLEWITSFEVFCSDEELRAYFAAARPELYTDMRPAFEYETPIGLSLPIAGHDLGRWSARRLPPMEPPPSAGEAAGLLGLRLLQAGDARGALQQFVDSERLLGRPEWQHEIALLRRGLGGAQPR
jgi:spermidine synthase